MKKRSANRQYRKTTNGREAVRGLQGLQEYPISFTTKSHPLHYGLHLQGGLSIRTKRVIPLTKVIPLTQVTRDMVEDVVRMENVTQQIPGFRKMARTGKPLVADTAGNSTHKNNAET